MPSQQQVRWAQLRVGATVLISSITLFVLIFLMSGTTGIFTKNIYLKTYLANAGTLRVGAPVRLQGVDIGNVKKITYQPGKSAELPVEVDMKVGTTYLSSIRKDTTAAMTTAGVLGEAFIDLKNTKSTKGPIVVDGDSLESEDAPDFNNIIKSSQTNLEKLDAILLKMDVIVTNIQEGKGSVGKLINDPELFNRTNKTLAQLQQIVEEIGSGKGSIGKLVSSQELYDKINVSVDKLNRIVDDLNAGKGNAGRLLKDESLYKNANETIAKANHMMDDIKDKGLITKIDNTVNRISQITDHLAAGEGTAGKILKDPSLYNNADQMLVETRNLIKAIRENPKKYLTIHFKIF